MWFLRAYLGSLVVFLVMDAVWLGVVASQFYAEALGDLLRPQPNWVAAGLFYLGYVAGVVWFAVRPAASWRGAALNGALLGLLCYATYDMTNLATLKGWPVLASFVDIAWGGVITAASATAGCLLSRRRT